MLKVDLDSMFFNRIIEREINKILRKNLGLDVRANLENFTLVENGDKVQFEISAKGEISRSSLIAIANKV